ncbi:MAG: ergothioneine biosynthesis protein EgtB [Lysobacteraceae bacterium]
MLNASTASLAERFAAVRSQSVALAAPLSAEDAMVQSMPDASPAKWHLAHTTWFFETFLLGALPGYEAIHPSWDYLFNSYYNSVGPMHARPQRGLLSRPALAQVLDWREQVDARIERALARGDFDASLQQRIALGLQHEQQHQELLLTDIKHALWCNPLQPAYRDNLPTPSMAAAPALRWISGVDGVVEIGAPPWSLHARFAFDSESPRHRALLHPHALASRPITNAEYRDFINDGGYRTAMLWLSEGWAQVQASDWIAPLYWDADCANEFTLGGLRTIDPGAPVTQISYYEADAFARWAGARLPTEFEWEHAAASVPVCGNFVESEQLQPLVAGGVDDNSAASSEANCTQLFGDVWEWTSSAYLPYPGFAPLPGSLGEYNGKFMCGQQVLRGGSCVSPTNHLRASYRNFFPPSARWQFSGVRLAKEC